MAPSVPTWSGSEATTPGARSQDYDDAEKGLYDSSLSLTASTPTSDVDEKALSSRHIESIPSPVHEGITPSASQPVLSVPAFPSPVADASVKAPADAPVAPAPNKNKPLPRRKISRWIRFQLWFNTYRKFFVLITALNLTGIVMTALGRFPYGQDHLGALVLGNLLAAVMFRNELFLRFLYLVAIYGLRSVRQKTSGP